MGKFVSVLAVVMLALSVQASEFSIPSFAIAGDRATLECNVPHGETPIKSITWSKDDKVFYHQTGDFETPTISEVNGVVVDEELSSNGTHIVIQSLTPESAGLYTCKFEIDHPSLNLAELSGTLNIIQLVTRSNKLPPGW